MRFKAGSSPPPLSWGSAEPKMTTRIATAPTAAARHVLISQRKSTAAARLGMIGGEELGKARPGLGAAVEERRALRSVPAPRRAKPQARGMTRVRQVGPFPLSARRGASRYRRPPRFVADRCPPKAPAHD